jgi:hypothetical protein
MSLHVPIDANQPGMLSIYLSRNMNQIQTGHNPVKMKAPVITPSVANTGPHLGTYWNKD